MLTNKFLTFHILRLTFSRKISLCGLTYSIAKVQLKN